MKKEFLEVLKKVEKEMPIIGKNLTVSFKSVNYKYAPLDKIWAKIKLVLRTNGFIITNESTTDGVKTIAHHELGELSSIIPYTSSVNPQGRGAEITYYRRYNLTAMFNIMVVGEDNDGFIEQNRKPTLADINTKEKFLRCNAPTKLKVKEYNRKKSNVPIKTDEDLFKIFEKL